MECPECGKKYATKSNFNRHQKTGACKRKAEKECTDLVVSSNQISNDTICPNCSRQYATKYSLQTHIKSGACQRKLVAANPLDLQELKIDKAVISSYSQIQKFDVLRDFPESLTKFAAYINKYYARRVKKLPGSLLEWYENGEVKRDSIRIFICHMARYFVNLVDAVFDRKDDDISHANIVLQQELDEKIKKLEEEKVATINTLEEKHQQISDYERHLPIEERNKREHIRDIEMEELVESYERKVKELKKSYTPKFENSRSAEANRIMLLFNRMSEKQLDTLSELREIGFKYEAEINEINELMNAYKPKMSKDPHNPMKTRSEPSPMDWIHRWEMNIDHIIKHSGLSEPI